MKKWIVEVIFLIAIALPTGVVAGEDYRITGNSGIMFFVDVSSAQKNNEAKIPQNRSCHEQRRSPRGNVIIRDGTPTDCAIL